jgi:hypothetical protein
MSLFIWPSEHVRMKITPRHGRWLVGNLKAGGRIASACLSLGYIRLKRGVEWQLGGENIRQTIPRRTLTSVGGGPP